MSFRWSSSLFVKEIFFKSTTRKFFFFWRTTRKVLKRATIQHLYICTEKVTEEVNNVRSLGRFSLMHVILTSKIWLCFQPQKIKIKDTFVPLYPTSHGYIVVHFFALRWTNRRMLIANPCNGPAMPLKGNIPKWIKGNYLIVFGRNFHFNDIWER